MKKILLFISALFISCAIKADVVILKAHFTDAPLKIVVMALEDGTYVVRATNGVTISNWQAANKIIRDLADGVPFIRMYFGEMSITYTHFPKGYLVIYSDWNKNTLEYESVLLTVDYFNTTWFKEAMSY